MKDRIVPDGSAGPVTLSRLDREMAQRHKACLAGFLDTIPCVDWTPNDVTAEEKRGVPLSGKWGHSLIACDGARPVGVLLAYERRAEDNVHYPHESLHIAGLAVDPARRGQGIGRALLRQFIAQGLEFMRCSGQAPVFSVQTNNADFNRGVRALYESCGFQCRALKHYENRTDAVLYLEPEQAEQGRP